MVKITKTQDIDKHFSRIIVSDSCTFTLKPIKKPALVKVDDGSIFIVDK